jgi:hypothetical protein
MLPLIHRYAPKALLLSLLLASCGGPNVIGREGATPETCSNEYVFKPQLSDNVLAITVTRDLPGDTDQIVATLTYKQSPAQPSRYELIAALDPDDATLVDQPPALAADVTGSNICLQSIAPPDTSNDPCLQTWLATQRCYELAAP